MPKRRNLHLDSQDPDEPPRDDRLAPPPAGSHPAVAGLTLPPTFFGARAMFLLLRLGRPQPVRLTFIAAATASDRDIEEVFRRPIWKMERRAPGVYDVDIPSDRIEELLTKHPHLFRRVDAPGWIFGEKVASPAARAEVAIATDEPMTGERKRDLARVGFHPVGESPAEVRGVVLGRDIAELLTLTWIGPVEVRKVHRAKE